VRQPKLGHGGVPVWAWVAIAGVLSTVASVWWAVKMYKQHGILSSAQQQQLTVMFTLEDRSARKYALLADALALGKMLSFAVFVLFSVLPDGAVECTGLGIEMVVQDKSAHLIGTNPFVLEADVRRSCGPSVPAAHILRGAFVGAMVLNSGLFLICMLLRYNTRAFKIKDATVAAMWLGGCFASWTKMVRCLRNMQTGGHFY